MSVSSDVAERFIAMPESSAVALRINIDAYFDVLRGLMDRFLIEKNLECIYITSTIPAQSIINAFNVLEINMDNIYFIDCVAHLLTGSAKETDKVSFIESPTMLENVLLKIEYLMRKLSDHGKRKLILLDSINSFAIHNNPKILSEFMHILVNNLRSKNAYTVILTIAEQSNEEIQNMTNFVCDDTIVVEGEGGG